MEVKLKLIGYTLVKNLNRNDWSVERSYSFSAMKIDPNVLGRTEVCRTTCGDAIRPS